MTLAEAIEIFKIFLNHDLGEFDEDIKGAIKLGIEALKLINQEPPEGYTCIPRPLPGETRD